MKPSAIQVAIDILRELGREEEARWIEHPDAVRALLKDPPADRNGECPSRLPSGGVCNGDPHMSHRPGCSVVTAWRALGDQRAQLDIENAHDEALSDERIYEAQRREKQEAAEVAARIAAMTDDEVVERVRSQPGRDSLHEFFRWGAATGFWPTERAERLMANYADVPASQPRAQVRTSFDIAHGR